MHYYTRRGCTFVRAANIKCVRTEYRVAFDGNNDRIRAACPNFIIDTASRVHYKHVDSSHMSSIHSMHFCLIIASCA